MNMSKIKINKNKLKIKKHQQARKKHVETMFITNKQKKYPFYFKPSNMLVLREKNNFKLTPSRGSYYIRSLESGYLPIGPLKAIVRLYKWFIKNYRLEEDFKYRLFAFPDFMLTSKPKEVRMGKGKGGPSKRVAIIKSGQLFLGLNFKRTRSRRYLAVALLKKMIHKLPFKTIISANFW